jgi:hypothetical protein
MIILTSFSFQPKTDNLRVPRQVHSKPYISPMGKREKEYLVNLYEYEIRNLERLLGWDCGEWLIP